MKTAVIYYSYEGNSALVAEGIGGALNADIFEIKTRNNKKRSGFAKYAWGVSHVFLGIKPALLPLAADVTAYDLVVFGTPVWAGSPAPAMVSFLRSASVTGKKLALFCCHAGGMGKVFDKLKALLPGNTVLGEADFMNPKQGDPAALQQKINEWVKTLGA